MAACSSVIIIRKETLVRYVVARALAHKPKDSSSVGGAISVHIMLYIGWGKDGHVDGFYMQSFECKRIHSE